MEEFLPRSFSDGNVADVCKYGTERDTLLQPLFLKFGWDCTVFGNFSPRRPYKVIVCVCVCVQFCRGESGRKSGRVRHRGVQ